ncbi:glycosyltransferase [Actinomyces sp. B33]|uniref:glycosyltransferase n=1 Tax=Actinomyces sp. B33 TaxID=2942131 RepID=UPI00233FCC8C|nr:glycosyltransferase [Actinomyces sp. B33]MDC4232634.1 glycosyltransferase [Actinomyces sp. B33]
MRVALTKGTLWVPPTYFAVEHALAMPDIDWRAFVLCADITDPRVSLKVDEAAPGAGRWPRRAREPLKWAALGRMRRRIVSWGPGVVHQQQATWSLPAVRAARDLGAPLVTTLHGGDAYWGPSGIGGRGAAGAWNRRNVSEAFAASRLLLAVSRHLADVALDSGAPAGRVEVHYQGVDTDYWAPGPPASTTPGPPAVPAPGLLPSDDGSPVLLHVGALSALKGIPDLLAARERLLARAPHRLVLVGDGPWRAEAERAAARDPGIVVAGALARDRVREWMRRADALVLATRTTGGRSEAAGLVSLEAQACGLPVVVTGAGGAPEMVSPACRPLLASQADPDSLARSLMTALSLDAGERRTIGASARRWVVEHRSVAAATLRLRDIYSRAVD